MPFLYGTTNEIKNLETDVIVSKIKQKFEKKLHKTSNFNWKLFIQIFSGIGTSLLYLIPGLGSLSKLALDISINLVVDTAFALVEKQSTQEVLTNLALDILPAAGYLSRYFKNVTKNKILFAAKQSKIVEFEQGVNKLIRNEVLHTKTPLYKKFGLTTPDLVKQVKNQYNFKNLLNTNEKQLTKALYSQKIVQNLNKKISWITNYYRAITQPRYLGQKTLQYLVEKLGIPNYWNQIIKESKKNLFEFIAKKMPEKIKSKYLPRVLETLKEWKKSKSVLLPLRHTSQEPWIIGVKLQNSGAPNYFHISWYFNPKTKKPKIISFYKPYHFILDLLKSNSAGNWYIQNICWGWNFNKIFGGHIFTNPFFSNKWVLFSKWPLLNQYLSTTARLYRTVKTFSQTNAESFIENWQSVLTNQFWNNLFSSYFLSVNFPGSNIAKKIYASSNSGNWKFLTNYVSKNKIRRYISTSQRHKLTKHTKNYTQW